MMKPVLLFFLLGVSSAFDVEDDECPRYSVEDFKESVFNPVFKQELSRLQYALDGGIAGLADVLSGLEGRGTAVKKEEMDAIKSVLGQLQTNSALLFPKMAADVEAAWKPLLKPEKPFESLEEMRLLFQKVHMALHAIHYEVDEPFTDLAYAAKTILDPMVKVLEIFVEKNNSEENRADMKAKMKEKDKLLGRVIADIVFASVDKEPIEDADYVYNLNEFWSRFTTMFYLQGLLPHESKEENPTEPKLNMPEFFKLALDTYQGWTGDINCVGEPGKECDDNHLVSTLSSVIFNTESKDSSWMPNEEELKDLKDNMGKLNERLQKAEDDKKK